MNPNELLAASLTLIHDAKTAFNSASQDARIPFFGQMVQFATIASDERGREGYAAVVEMMKSTTKTIGILCERVNVLVAELALSTTSTSRTQVIYTELGTLRLLLDQVGAIAPTNVWAKVPK